VLAIDTDSFPLIFEIEEMERTAPVPNNEPRQTSRTSQSLTFEHDSINRQTIPAFVSHLEKQSKQNNSTVLRIRSIDAFQATVA
jgi:hypothetical protein